MRIEKEGRSLSLGEFERLTGALFIPKLIFGEEWIGEDLLKRAAKARKKGELSREQLWLGALYRGEIEEGKVPELSIRWIDKEVGWGVFAEKRLKKRAFVAEYTGVLRKRRREDQKNSYCFEYKIGPEVETPYLIDAREQGGLSRYINHGKKANLVTALAMVDEIAHVILYTEREIEAGEQLVYDYGEDYWSKRVPPRSFI